MTSWLPVSLAPGRFVSTLDVQFSALLDPHAAAQPFASSWPLLAPPVGRCPHRRKIEIGQRRSLSPPQPTNLDRRHQILAIVLEPTHYRVMARGASAALTGSNVRPFLPSFQSPTAGPPAHTRTTANLALLGLKCRLPSAVPTFGPDEFRPRLGWRAVSCRRLPERDGSKQCQCG